MNWHEFVQAVSQDSGYPIHTVDAVIRSSIRQIEAALLNGQVVSLRGFGRFEARWRPERTIRDLNTMRKVAIDGAWFPRFSPSEGLRERLRARSPQRLKDPAHQAAWRLGEALVGDLNAYFVARTPRLVRGMHPSQLETLCQEAFGPAWAQARATYERQVPAAVRESQDYLMASALRRWAEVAA